jgi:hypothetical protein
MGMCLPTDWKCLIDKVTQSVPYFLFIMTREVMIGALKQGQTGDEILAILNAITGNNTPHETVSVEPTLEPIEF